SSIRLCFFFSSRRRHTRFSRDWSSDVCSSDLSRLSKDRVVRGTRAARRVRSPPSISALPLAPQGEGVEGDGVEAGGLQLAQVARSEERRVGKECRSRRTRGTDMTTTARRRKHK